MVRAVCHTSCYGDGSAVRALRCVVRERMHGNQEEEQQDHRDADIVAEASNAHVRRRYIALWGEHHVRADGVEHVQSVELVPRSTRTRTSVSFS